MDLRSLPDGLTPHERCTERRHRIESELNLDLGTVDAHEAQLGHAEERNCEQMFGTVPIPVGYAGPLSVTFSNGKNTNVHLPLATTEGALVASVNRGCKALSLCGSVKTSAEHHGMTRSMAFRCEADLENGVRSFFSYVQEHESDWRAVAEQTSTHLKILSFALDEDDDHVFLTIACDTDEAMGMNMVTIAAQAAGTWLAEHSPTPVTFVTVAGNVDSDKKPSQRTHDTGRGYTATAEVTLSPEVMSETLKTDAQAMLDVATAKLTHGSAIAGALGANLHAANIVAALYLATGQDAAHVVEGSLADTVVTRADDDHLRVAARCPAVLVGVRGGGTTLPAQSQCLSLLLQPDTGLHPCQQLAETIAAAVLAGEVSLLAAQAGHQLAKAHNELGR